MTDEAAANNEEQVLLIVRKHWASLLQNAIVILVPGVIIVFLLWIVRAKLTQADIATHALVTFLVPLCFLIIWIMLAMFWTNYYLTMLVITDRRMFYSSQINIANRTIREWAIPDIRHVQVRLAGVFESLFNYGALEIETLGEHGSATIEEIPDPEYVAAVILRQDDRYGQMKRTAREQAELLRFMSHEIKGHLTKSKAAFAAIVEGDYGPVPDTLHSMAGEALADTQRGVDTVMSILDGADARRGGMKMDMRIFDLSETVRRAVNEMRPVALRKKLAVNAAIADFCIIRGDEQKIERHVIRNLLDNALRYTPQGMITVTLEKADGRVRFSVVDTGVGIASSDMQKLFTQGGHGAHSRDVNPESTGYGLYIAKEIVDAHDGRIWANSSGPGTGSQFFADFPLAK